jgi:menaquinone-dependent protoporphyrinogen oxidase
MEVNILVAYASTHGSTKEVAEAVVATIRELDLRVDLMPARNVRTLDGYNLVVLGAPLYMFQLHKDALRFLRRYQKPLAGGMPVAIIAGGSIENGDENERQEVRTQLDKQLAKFPWLKPVAVEIIGGRFDPTSLRFPWNLIPALKNKPPIDLRDWAAIHSWAGSLVGNMRTQ